jgi:NADH-quinone oxidoreductase subunit L
MLMQEFAMANPGPVFTNCYGPQSTYLWLVPALPIVAAGVIALLKQPKRKTASTLAIGSLSLSLILSLFAFAHVLQDWTRGIATRDVCNFTWIHVGTTNIDLGWVLDPLSAVMLVMVTFVGLLIFIYSTSYMAHDENYTRFFCFLSLASLQERCWAW